MWPFNNRREQKHTPVINDILPVLTVKPPKKEIEIGEDWIAEGEFGLVIIKINKYPPNPWRMFKGKPMQFPLPKELIRGDIFYFLVKGGLSNLEYLLIVQGECEVIKGDLKKWREKFNFLKNCYFTTKHVERLRACD